MLAPRKTLWSSPPEIVPILMNWIVLKPNDVILDVGCGDASILLLWATQASASLPVLSQQQHGNHSTIKFIGIEIDAERASLAKENIQRAYRAGLLDPNKVTVEIRCENALDAKDCFAQATIVFLYLIPRGLKIIKPLLRIQQEQPRSSSSECDSMVQVVTYMSPLLDETPVAKCYCKVPHQPEAAWPLYLFHLDKAA